MITATNNLNGFTLDYSLGFSRIPNPYVVVHQIINVCKYMLWKDRKEFPPEKKHIYDAPAKDIAKAALEDSAVKWEGKYIYAIQS